MTKWGGRKADWKRVGDNVEAQRICDKWAKRLGWGFHPDTRAADYHPALLWVEAQEYDRDIRRLFSLDVADPYAFGVEALNNLQRKGAK